MFFSIFNQFSIPRRKVRASVHISEKFKCVYVVTPKVACSTVLKAMHFFEVDGDETLLPENPHIHKSSPMAKLPLFNFSSHSPLTDASYFRFSFVRNPYTRVTSAFLNKFNINHPKRARYMGKLGLPPDRELSFLEFLRIVSETDPGRLNKHWMPLSLVLQADRINYDFIGRFENFSEDLNDVLMKIYKAPYEDARFRRAHHAVNAGNKISDLIGFEEKALIEKIYAQDFERFDYARDLPGA